MTAAARATGLCSQRGSAIRHAFQSQKLAKTGREDAYLVGHVAGRGAVEVVVGPLGKCVFSELVGGAVVAEGELGVRFEELRYLHFLAQSI